MKKIIVLVILQVLCSTFVWADLKGDINGDDKVGLEEAVYALQATSGLAVQPVEDTCINCSGTIWNADNGGTRWCDQGDGTVKDMETGLVWLKDASWGGVKEWANSTTWDDAHTRAGILRESPAGGDLSDGSVEGDWRLPTKKELYGLANGNEAVRSVSMQAFTGVKSTFYWSSTSYASNTVFAWHVAMYYGFANYIFKGSSYSVWPVRSDN